MNVSEDSWRATEEPIESTTNEVDTILEKEALVKDIISTQQGLSALLNRVEIVQTESNKLKESNIVLQTYIDNLTRNNAIAAQSR